MQSEVESAILIPAVSPSDHIDGQPTAKVTLVEFGDYECPMCGNAYPSIKEVQNAMGQNLRFVFRNFPISTIHPHAELAAEAAESAAAQGKFWEMHDILYENQDRLDVDSLLLYASTLGLNQTRFAEDLQGRKFQQKVKRDFMNGIESGVNGTPTFFINGVHYSGSYDPRTLLAAIEGSLLY